MESATSFVESLRDAKNPPNAEALENAMYRVLQLYGGTVVQARPTKIHNPLPPNGRVPRDGARTGRRGDDDQQGGRRATNVPVREIRLTH